MKRLLGATIALCFAAVSAMFGQGITTSSMTGTVNDKSGKPVAGASVTIVHEPSGTRTTTVTRSNGQFDVSGLRPGGPYTVTSGTDVRRDVFVDLGQVADIVLPSTDIVKMEAFGVTGERDTSFDANKMSGGSSFNDAQIANIASIRGDVQDIARLDSRLTLTSLDQGGQLSAQGQNFRFNSFLIDGVESNDPFGLNSNGVTSLRSPVALETLQAISIELNPYDVRHSGFTGALINAVTKSGTNQYEGVAYYERTAEDWRAKNPRTGAKESFKERRYGIWTGGPIIKDRLFFALSFDDFRRESTAPAAGFVFTPASLALVDQVIAKAKALGYDPGTLGGANNVATQKIYTAKINWNITDQHKLEVGYRKVEGTAPVFAGVTSTTGTSLSNSWYDTPRDTKTITGQLNSQWTPDFRTEAVYSQNDFDASPVNRGKPFPAIGIGGLAGTNTATGLAATGFLNFGTEFSRQLNQLTTKDKIYKLTGEYSWGNHVFAAGGELASTKIDNRFLQAYYGSYTFNNSGTAGTPTFKSGVDNWLAGTPTSYTDAQPFAGSTIDQVFAKWTYDAYAFLLQDTWRPTNRLTFLFGLRYDMPTVSAKPPFNQAFYNAFGLRNDDTIDGNNTLAPRVGFNYRLPVERKTELRGGIGLFQGRNPAVWLANSYQNAGNAGSITINTNGTGQPVVLFQPDVTKQPIPAGTLPVPTINLTAPGFKQPSSWKGNIALDHQLPFGGLVVTAEYTQSKVEKALYIEFLNFQTATTGPTTTPDGRIRYAGNITPGYSTNATPNFATAPYNPATTTFAQTNTNGRRRIASFADVYRLNNTSEGGSHDFTLQLNRPFKNKWSAGVSWTRGNASEVSPMTSSTAGSLFTTRAVYNPNENVASTSNTTTKDKIVAQYTRQFEFFKGYKTTTSFVYEARTGRTYSWVFAGDANGDGITGNDLFYMPNGPTDSKVTWFSTTERDAFFAYAAANGLTKYSGQVLPRNSATSPWNQTLDITITQQIPLYKKLHAEVYVQLMNLGNLLNDNWGLLEEVPFTYKRSIAGATYDPATNKYGYVFNGNTSTGLPIVADDTQSSRWQAKVGMRIRF
jgi:hypothetical protein